MYFDSLSIIYVNKKVLVKSKDPFRNRKAGTALKNNN